MSFEVGDKVIVIGADDWSDLPWTKTIKGKRGVVTAIDVVHLAYSGLYIDVQVDGVAPFSTLPFCLKKVGEEQLLFAFMKEGHE